MQIDVISDQLFPFARAADVIVRLGFPRPSSDNLKRWRSDGVGGHKIKTRRLGARYYTTEALVREFVAACDGGAR